MSCWQLSQIFECLEEELWFLDNDVHASFENDPMTVWDLLNSGSFMVPDAAVAAKEAQLLSMA